MLYRINIFIAEDHKLLRQLLSSTLETFQIITIGEAGDGLELLELLKIKMPDVIVLDIEMPNMTGSEVFYKIRELYPELKIIFLTTHNEVVLMEHFIAEGASAYLNKSVDIDVLAKVIRLVHENKYEYKYKASLSKFENGQTLKFSKRETEMIPLICEGRSNKEIADVLDIGNKAVEMHKKNLFKKTKTKSSTSFINYILRKGLIHLNQKNKVDTMY